MAKANQVSLPYVDPTVQHVGVTRLRSLNVAQLRDLDRTLVIQDNDKPLAVLLRYDHFMAMQEQLQTVKP
jgi:translation initiation factor IF-3